jgi:hypothetical protein
MKCQRNIVLLMLEGFDFGTPAIASQLTGALAALKDYNGLSVPVEYFDAAMEKLREKFLSVPVDAVLHQASAFARGAAEEQQTAAAAAPVAHLKTDFAEAEIQTQPSGLLHRPAKRLSHHNSYALLGALFVLVIGKTTYLIYRPQPVKPTR